MSRGKVTIFIQVMLGILVVAIGVLSWNYFFPMNEESVSEETSDYVPDVPAPALPAKPVPQKPAEETVKVPPAEPVKEEAGEEITRANIFILVNNERIDAGMPVLARNDALDRAAAAKLEDMLEGDYFAHQSPEGYGHHHWIAEAGYVGSWEGENLARNFDSAPETVAAWMDSPTHRANIMKAEYKETGIAVKGSYVVQIFATPAGL